MIRSRTKTTPHAREPLHARRTFTFAERTAEPAGPLLLTTTLANAGDELRLV